MIILVLANIMALQIEEYVGRHAIPCQYNFEGNVCVNKANLIDGQRMFCRNHHYYMFLSDDDYNKRVMEWRDNSQDVVDAIDVDKNAKIALKNAKSTLHNLQNRYSIGDPDVSQIMIHDAITKYNNAKNNKINTLRICAHTIYNSRERQDPGIIRRENEMLEYYNYTTID